MDYVDGIEQSGLLIRQALGPAVVPCSGIIVVTIVLIVIAVAVVTAVLVFVVVTVPVIITATASVVHIAITTIFTIPAVPLLLFFFLLFLSFLPYLQLHSSFGMCLGSQFSSADSALILQFIRFANSSVFSFLRTF